MRISTATLLVCLMASSAAADTLRPGSQYGFITKINKGVMELGLDNVLNVRSNSETTTPDAGGDETTSKTLGAFWAGGPTFRYFIVDNLSLSANVNAELNHTSSETTVGPVTTESSITEVGFLATAMADYYVSVGRNMFIKPGIGGGYFRLSGDVPISAADPSLVREVVRSGGVGRVQLSFVYYTSTKFNLKAGIDVLARFGTKETDGETGSSTSLLEIDAAWNVGFAYVF